MQETTANEASQAGTGPPIRWRPPVQPPTPARWRHLVTRAERLRGWLFAWLERRDWYEGATLMVFGALVGVVTGLGVVGFYRLIDVCHLIFIRWPASRLPGLAHAFYQPLLTALGLWAAWLVIKRTRTPDGQNVPDVQLAVAKRNGVIATPPVIARTIARNGSQ